MGYEVHVEPLERTGDRSDFLAELVSEDGVSKGSIRVEITRTASAAWAIAEDDLLDAASAVSRAIFEGSRAMQVGARFRFTSHAGQTLSEAIERARANPTALQEFGDE